MTGEEIINNLLYMKRYVKENTIEDSTIDEAIKALEQQPYDDCIRKQVVLDMLQDINAETEGVGFYYEHYVKYIKDLPSVTPKEKTGRWISFGIQGEIDGQIVRAFTCSKCGAISIFRVSNGNIVNGDLCPNCGAKMIKPQESEVQK